MYYSNSQYQTSHFICKFCSLASVKRRETRIFSQGVLSGYGEVIFMVISCQWSFLITFLIGLEHMQNYSNHVI